MAAYLAIGSFLIGVAGGTRSIAKPRKILRTLHRSFSHARQHLSEIGSKKEQLHPPQIKGGFPLGGVFRGRELRARVATSTATSSNRGMSTKTSSGQGDNRGEAGTLEDIKKIISQSNNILVLTGAGCSTRSGIPDYRGQSGSYAKGHKPMEHDQFISSHEERQRYWARSLKGWPPFYNSKPNAAHYAIAELERMGKVRAIITQNVDGLHQKAESKNVLELHGTNSYIRCMSCGELSERNAYQRLLSALNMWWVKKHDKSTYVPEWNIKFREQLRADGDAELGEGLDYSQIRVPGCTKCGGIWKPDVVYFGDTIPKDRVRSASEAVSSSDLLLVCGSSLPVLSSFRLVLQASKENIPIVVINIGETRAEREGIPHLKVDAEVGTTLEACVAFLRSREVMNDI